MHKSKRTLALGLSLFPICLIILQTVSYLVPHTLLSLSLSLSFWLTFFFLFSFSIHALKRKQMRTYFWLPTVHASRTFLSAFIICLLCEAI